MLRGKRIKGIDWRKRQRGKGRRLSERTMNGLYVYIKSNSDVLLHFICRDFGWTAFIGTALLH